MKIEIKRVYNNPSQYKGEESSSIFELEGDQIIKFKSPLYYDVIAEAIPGELVIHGVLTVNLSLRCSFCNDFFDSIITVPDFMRVIQFVNISEVVDLTNDMRESMLLALPFYPVCRPGCKGLCFMCGANLNYEKCSCKPVHDMRWDVLDKLNFEKMQNGGKK